jgi:large subunit ribosomal protein L17
MRHAVSGNKFGRHSSWRKATVRDLARATLKEQRICTTKAKAKEARKLVDRLITWAKRGTLAHRRMAFAVLCDHVLVSDLFNKMAGRFRARTGGYTRIIPLSHRRGDSAQLVFLELTEIEKAVASKPKKIAAAKPKASPATPVEGKRTQPELAKPEGVEDKKPEVTKEPIKPKVKPEAPKSGKKIIGGFRKMFQRKTGE